MKLIVHDYAGHAFPVQLSRELARRGRVVTHIYAGYNQTPRGPLAPQGGDPATLTLRGLYIKSELDKRALLRRWQQEREYGQLLARAILADKPDIVLSANTPIDAQRAALNAAGSVQSKFVFWLQDLIGEGTRTILRERLPLFGSAIGGHYIRVEESLLRQSDSIVGISDTHVGYLAEHGIDQGKVHCIPNWAPIEEIPTASRDNRWARAHGLGNCFSFLYSGTLGMKHDPGPIAELARHFKADPSVRIVLISEGKNADWLKAVAVKEALQNLQVLPFQRCEEFPEVLATGDVLVGVLDAGAGRYSVPSKVLSYLCAGRAILLAMPEDNLAAQTVLEAGAGIVVPPNDWRALVEAAELLRKDAALRNRLGANGRAYAEAAFQIGPIADKFEAVLDQTARGTFWVPAEGVVVVT